MEMIQHDLEWYHNNRFYHFLLNNDSSHMSTTNTQHKLDNHSQQIQFQYNMILPQTQRNNSQQIQFQYKLISTKLWKQQTVIHRSNSTSQSIN